MKPYSETHQFLTELSRAFPQNIFTAFAHWSLMQSNLYTNLWHFCHPLMYKLSLKMANKFPSKRWSVKVLSNLHVSPFSMVFVFLWPKNNLCVWPLTSLGLTPRDLTYSFAEFITQCYFYHLTFLFRSHKTIKFCLNCLLFWTSSIWHLLHQIYINFMNCVRDENPPLDIPKFLKIHPEI